MFDSSNFEFVVLAAVQFLLYAIEVATADYYFASLCSDHVEGGVIFLLPTRLVNILSH